MPTLRPFHFANQFLDALPLGYAYELSFELDVAYLFTGQQIRLEGDACRHVLFPTSAVIALETARSDGSLQRIANIGLDGVTPGRGLPRGLATQGPVRLEVVQSGLAYRMSAARFQQWAADSLEVGLLLKLYEERLCRRARRNTGCAPYASGA